MYSIGQDYRIISRTFCARHTCDVARDLLGMYLVRWIYGVCCIGRIVETEAYTSDDPACHAYRGQTQRNVSLFGPVGHAYVYLIYGIHTCCNVVAYDASQHVAGGVLIRAIEPIAGIATMRYYRNMRELQREAAIASGPGKLTQALYINRNLDGYNLCEQGDCMIMQRVHDAPPVYHTSPRIGISLGRDVYRRWYISDNAHVSR